MKPGFAFFLKDGKPRRAFTLVELLVVFAIVAILVALIAPAMTSLARASALTTAGQAVLGTLEQARQMAVTRNRPVEVRFYKLAAHGEPISASPTTYRAVQLYIVDSNANAAPVATATGKVLNLPVPIVISTNPVLSSLMELAESSPASGENFSTAGTNYRYRAFQFRPNGGTDLQQVHGCFFTLHAANDPIGSNGAPSNFITIQVDPQTGRSKAFH